MRELLSVPLGAALRRVQATGHAEGVPKADLKTLVVLGLLAERPEGAIQVTQLGRDLLQAEDLGS